MFELTKLAVKDELPKLMVGMMIIFEVLVLPLSILGVAITKLVNKE